VESKDGNAAGWANIIKNKNTVFASEGSVTPLNAEKQAGSTEFEPSSFAKTVAVRFSKWPAIEFIKYEAYADEINDFRVHYQMELVTIVFLLSLRSLKTFILKQQIKIDVQGAQQLAVDIKLITQSIIGSDMVMSHDENFQIAFKQKLLGLDELKKWKRMIQILIETQFGTYVNEMSSYEMSVGSQGSNE
jgi:hypothetical protein